MLKKLLTLLMFAPLLYAQVNFQTAKLYKADISAKQAYEMQQEGVVLIDARTKREFNTLHPKGSINIPVFFEKNGKRVFNQNFPNEVYELQKKNLNTKLILICRTGSRTKLASNILANLGFKEVYNVQYGFALDWTKVNLPVAK